MTYLNPYINTISNLCQKHRVESLFVFGSVLTEKFNERSDIDMVVKFDSMDLMEYADNYFDLKEQLEDVLKRQIDLLEEQAIRNPLLKMRINESKQLIYGKGN